MPVKPADRLNKAILDLPHLCATCGSKERSQVRVFTKLHKGHRSALLVTDGPLDIAKARYYVKLGAPQASRAQVDAILQRLTVVVVKPNLKAKQSFADALLADPDALAKVETFFNKTSPDGRRIDPWKPEEVAGLADHFGVRTTQNAPADIQGLGSKSGARDLFTGLNEKGVQPPPGSRHLVGIEAIEDYIFDAASASKTRKFLIKLNKGQAGEGNAIVDLSAAQGRPVSRDEVVAAVDGATRLGHKPLSKEAYTARLSNEKEGAVVEHFLPGPLREASGKIRITANGVKVIGLHMQRMGQGDTNTQSFIGGSAPADEDISPHVAQQVRAIGEAIWQQLQAAGVKNPKIELGVDFLVTGSEPKDIYANEINLRHTGMSPTDWAIQYVVGAEFDDIGALRLRGNRSKRFVETIDWIRHEAFKELKPANLIRLFKANGLHFDATKKTGVVIQAFEQKDIGRVPVVCVGSTPEQAKALLGKTLNVLAAWITERTGTRVVPSSLVA